MTPRAEILYVEDDAALGFVTRENLELRGYGVCHCVDGDSAMAEITNRHFDICILDVMLPQIDGFQLAREIRDRDPEVPIIFLTARSLQEDRIHGLRLGADDYLVKPYSLEELFLKIEIFLRRTRGRSQSPTGEMQIGVFRFSHTQLTLKHATTTIELTQKEAALLELFLRNRNVVLKRAHILESLWGENDYFMGRSLDVFVSRLRKHLQPDPSLRIENVHGVGFRLVTG